MTGHISPRDAGPLRISLGGSEKAEGPKRVRHTYLVEPGGAHHLTLEPLLARTFTGRLTVVIDIGVSLRQHVLGYCRFLVLAFEESG
jgi:hypothetical protein